MPVPNFSAGANRAVLTSLGGSPTAVTSQVKKATRVIRGVASGLSATQAKGKPLATELPAHLMRKLLEVDANGRKVGFKKHPELAQAHDLKDANLIQAVKEWYADPTGKGRNVVTNRIQELHSGGAASDVEHARNYVRFRNLRDKEKYKGFEYSRTYGIRKIGSKWWITNTSTGSKEMGPYDTHGKALEDYNRAIAEGWLSEE